MERVERIVIVGGGVAALEAALALRALLGGPPLITMVAPNEDFVYQPLSVAEPFALGATPHLPLREFADDIDVEWQRANVDAVGENHAVVLEGGGFVAYDKLIVATGAPREAAYPDATTFRGENDVQAVHGLVQDVEMGLIRRVAFVVPDGVAWSLPLYELALMTANRAYEMNVDVELTLVTPEDRPLGVFGAQAASDVEQRMKDAGIRLVTRTAAEIPGRGRLVVDGEEQEADRIIALPVSRGPAIPGLPNDADGFIPIDSFARVAGMDGVYAAGDGANFPLKQGGLACQQADAAAEHIAASLGRLGEPQPFRPVLRGRLVTDSRPLWSPATKVAGKYLAMYLTERERGVDTPSLTAMEEEGFETPLRGYEFSGPWGG